MAGRELILRFLAFHLREPTDYNGDMDKFLSDTMRFINQDQKINKNTNFYKWENISKDQRKLTAKLIEDFFLSMKRCHSFFGPYAFRKVVPEHRRTPVNKALFEAWSNIFCKMSDKEFKSLLERKEVFFIEYSKLLLDAEFDRAISRDASSTIGVRERYKKLYQLIFKTIEN